MHVHIRYGGYWRKIMAKQRGTGARAQAARKRADKAAMDAQRAFVKNKTM